MHFDWMIARSESVSEIEKLGREIERIDREMHDIDQEIQMLDRQRFNINDIIPMKSVSNKKI